MFLRATAKVFQAIQGHWLSACLGVLMDLKIPEILHAQGEKGIGFEQVLPACSMRMYIIGITESPRMHADVQLAKAAGVTPAGHDHFYKVLRAMAQWELLDETPQGRMFSANAATRELVRGKEASLGHFVDHQV